MTHLAAIIIVNLLTTIRIIGVIVLVPVFLCLGPGYTALLAIGCYFTDFLDGLIARKCHASTFFGCGYDALADKLFTVANLLVLLSVTRLAIIPILIEVAVIIVQSFKYRKNINVQSSKMGKIKTWIMGLTVVLFYIVLNVSNITKVSAFSFLHFLDKFDPTTVYLVIFIPLYLFETLTLISYLRFLEDYDPNKKIKVPALKIKLKPKTSLKNCIYNVRIFWFNHEFYEEYKDFSAMKELRKELRANRES